MLDTFGEHTQGQNLGVGHCFGRRGAISKHSRQFRHFRQPAAIFFAFALERQVHGRSVHRHWNPGPPAPMIPG